MSPLRRNVASSMHVPLGGGEETTESLVSRSTDPVCLLRLVTDRLQTITDEFQSVPQEMRVELLLEHARHFPPLPERFRAIQEAGLGRVHECQAEVYLFPEILDGVVHLNAAIPGHAPTQRALVGILIDAYEGAKPEDIAGIPDDLLRRLGVDALLGVQRQRGFAGVIGRIKHVVAEAARS